MLFSVQDTRRSAMSAAFTTAARLRIRSVRSSAKRDCLACDATAPRMCGMISAEFSASWRSRSAQPGFSRGRPTILRLGEQSL